MFDRRHPLGWLFYLLLAVAVATAQTETTTVSEVQYRARGGRWRASRIRPASRRNRGEATMG